MTGVYKITNPIGAVYIGSAISISSRFSNHRRLIHNHRKLKASLLKYGVENHSFEVIEECTKDILRERERYYGDLYDACSEFNLNCVLPATIDKPILMCESSRRIRSEIARKTKSGKKLSESTKQKIRLAHTGKKHSLEHRQKVSKNSTSARIVIDEDTGIFYDSIRDLTKYYNKYSHPYMLHMLSGRRPNKTQFKLA